MNTQAKIFIPLVLAFCAYAFFNLFVKKEIGEFETIRLSGEINQSTYLYIAANRGFQRDAQNRITSFFATDRNGETAQVDLEEPAPAEMANALVVEVFGHMHGNLFLGKRAEVAQLKSKE